MEYKKRLETYEKYMKEIELENYIIDEYGLREFTKNVVSNLENRCINYCYRVRLEETARFARENGFDAFTTTILLSPYQRHEELKLICEELSEKYNIKFLYRDFRMGFREGQNKAREMNMYMQKYCGCIYSEEERYLKK